MPATFRAGARQKHAFLWTDCLFIDHPCLRKRHFKVTVVNRQLIVRPAFSLVVRERTMSVVSDELRELGYEPISHSGLREVASNCLLVL